MQDIHLSNHIVICHFSTLENISKVMQEIERDRITGDAHIVVVDDAIDQLPVEFQKDTIHFVKGDPARESVLSRANVGAARAVMILSDADNLANSDNKNLRVALTLEQFDPEVYSVVVL